MADNSGKIGALGSLDPGLSTYTASSTKAKKNDQVDKNDFIQMLVTQLKNQDPMDPMDNQQFAVQLAQFSQLEQLISINEKVGSTDGAGGDVTSMASFLGLDVKLNAQNVNVKDGEGGSLSFKLEQDATNVQVQLLNANGEVVEVLDAGAMQAGDQSVALQQLKAPAGSYDVKIVAQTASGTTFKPEAYASGTVIGYRPGADPKLIVGNQEYSLSDVQEVRIPKMA